ncbi:Rid family hydrolase [Dysgonomonas sp. Marseille-P4361]|uniref:Rid family hydrolase n=1 Tax=Dysgonomonas sp. Marseille-P4361 TaxID=2161820 RepID=UPI000D562EB0|nr:Rid family hydrolase [Dysgonomonas sp. Marseille-P4361]
MKYTNIYWDDLAIQLKATSFDVGGNASEFHSILQITDSTLDVETQFLNIHTAIQRIADNKVFEGTDLIWKRYFVSDAINQSLYFEEYPNAVSSIVQQPPLNGTKVALWLYYIKGNNSILKEGNTLVVQRNGGSKHLYTAQLHAPLKNEYAETEYIFNSYNEILKQHQSTLKDNCIRTWIYVQGVDIHYQEMVKARVAYFEQEGLNKETHYIASTGIEGRHIHPHSLVLMDAYAIEGVKPGQIKFLHGLTHLNRTHDYGVTFERGTSIDFADRRHVYISGTASINNKGEIVHPHNVMKQLDRTLENINVLLSEAECGMTDIAQMIIYIRDIADYSLVNRFFDKNYIDIPKVIVLAPVCRPGWLIEIECIAIKNIANNLLPEF